MSQVTVSASALATTDEPEELIVAAQLASQRRTEREVDAFCFDGTLYTIRNIEGQQRVVPADRDLMPHPAQPTISIRTLEVPAEVEDGTPCIARNKDTRQLVQLNNQGNFRSL